MPSVPPPRYPQTLHLMDTGATSSDDKVLARDVAVGLLAENYVLEEKLDGANICLYLDGNGAIQAQNRSHGVCSQTSKQFSKLGQWIETHARQLRAVLQFGLVMYGEWMQAKHSVYYDALPDWFLVFDMLDLRSGRFLSVNARNRCLALVDLMPVPSVVVPEPRPATPEQLLSYLETLSSRFRSGAAAPEGVVLRVDHGPLAGVKAKLVNKGFIQTIEASGHWMHQCHIQNRRVVESPAYADHQVETLDASQAVGKLIAQAVVDGRNARYDQVLEACALARMWIPYSPMVENLRAQALVGKQEWSCALKSFKVCLQLLQLLDPTVDLSDPVVAGSAGIEARPQRLALLLSVNGTFTGAMAAPEALHAKCMQGLKLCRENINMSSTSRSASLASYEAQEADEREEGVASSASSHSQRSSEAERQMDACHKTGWLMTPRTKHVVKTSWGSVELMRNLSWIVPQQVLGASTPKSDEHVRALHEVLGITLIITLTEEEPLPAAWFKRSGVVNVFEPIVNQGAPPLPQALRIIKMMEEEIIRGGRVLVHCGGGKGRAGTILGSWLLLHGEQMLLPAHLEGQQSLPKLSAGEAARRIRELRPGSLESNAQYDFLWTLSQHAWKHVELNTAARTAPAASACAVDDDTLQLDDEAAAKDEAKGEEEDAIYGDSDALASSSLSGAARHACAADVSKFENHQSVAPPQFPRTAHFHLSPGFTTDDAFLSQSACAAWDDVVITEKIDGGNCCLWRGRVFARSHAHETKLPWFSAAKQIARDLFLRQAVPDHIALFGENLEAMHSIDYGTLRESPIYIIGALDMSQSDVFLSWDATCHLARSLHLPVAPVLYRGKMMTNDVFVRWVQQHMELPSLIGDRGAAREGVVVRVAGAIEHGSWQWQSCKYVRAGHVQTDASFQRTWRKASFAMPSLESSECLDHESPTLSTQHHDCPQNSALQQDSLEAGARDLGAEYFQHKSVEGSHSKDLPESTLTTCQAQAQQQQQQQKQQQQQQQRKTLSVTNANAPTSGVARGPRKRDTGWGKSKRPLLVMLVGIPGAGKSSFAKAVCCSAGGGRGGAEDARENCPWVVVSQDEIGSRSACEDAVGAVLGGHGRKAGRSVILDRCNVSPADRRNWLNIAMVDPKQAAVVYFDYDPQVCRKRVAERTDHPTIPFGRGARAVAQHSKDLVAPSAEEGFGRVDIVKSFADAETLARYYASL